jgi:hypothetical protein
MKLRLMFFAALVAAVLSTSLAAGSAFGAGSVVLYNAVPSPLPPNVASVGYEATSTRNSGTTSISPERIGTSARSQLP